MLYLDVTDNFGRSYTTVFFDNLCLIAYAKFYTSKMPITAAETLYDRVPPLETIDVHMRAVLSGKIHDFCSVPNQHHY